ncbi:phage major capsid protein [Acidovorax sp. LjRoot74]|uniref:phage major capsid protein n=1 Tax=Acidovorax sp. LjRoot74 TaxID=3342337 RepID=UPI003ECC3E42
MSSTAQLPEAVARHLTKGRAERAFLVERQAIDEEARTAVLAFASELPYERYWGVEILDCTATSMRQGRLRSGANLLCDHDTRDVVGVIESVEIGADRVARAVVRFGKSARAEEVWNDVRDGIRRNVSVGYMVHKAQLVETVDGVETYRVTDWEPFEVSLVSVPADASVGVGRSLDGAETPASDAAPAPQATTPTTTPSEPEVKTMPDPVVEVIEQRNHAAEISKIAPSIPGGAELAMDAIQRGLTVEQFQREAIAKMASKPVPTADIGMEKGEVKQYSLMRALNALANPTDAAAQRAAAFERECSDAAAAKVGKQARGFMVPNEVQRRDLVVGTPTAGGNMVATDLLTGSFIDILRNAMVIDGLGARMLTGLVGNVAIPKLTGSATAYWVAENSAPTESQQTVGQVTLTPKTVGAFTDIARRLLLQTSLDVEAMVQNDLATILGLAIQQAAINGTGASNQPSGILTQIASPTVVAGTNGAAPTWQNVIDLESAVAVANADVGTLAYLTNAKVRGKLKATSKVSGQNGFIWEGGDTPVNGYRAAVTNAVPSNLTKGTSSGVCSAAIFGNWADLVIGMWGGLDLMVDPYTGSAAGTVRVVALQDVDVALRNTVSFATVVDLLTV